MGETPLELEPIAEVLIQRHADSIQAELIGEIDMSNADDVLGELRTAWGDQDLPLRVDLTRVTFLDSSAIAALQRLNQESTDRTWSIAAPAHSVAGRTLRMIGMDAVLPVTD